MSDSTRSSSPSIDDTSSLKEVQAELRSPVREYRSKPDPAYQLNFFILLVATSSFALAFSAMFYLLLSLQKWEELIVQQGIATLDLSLPYLLIATVLLVFGAVMLAIRPRLVRDKLAWSIILQHSKTKQAFSFAAPLASSGSPKNHLNVLSPDGDDLEMIAAGEWVLDRMANGDSIVAIRKQNLNVEKLRSFLGTKDEIAVLHASSEKKVSEADD